MQGGIGPRFALEAGFLIALAIAAGVAQLSATAIVVVMAAAWLLICLFELAVWAEAPRFPALHRRTRPTEPAEITPGEQAGEPDEITPVDSVREPVAVAEPPALADAEPPDEQEGRRRFWRRRRAS